MELGRRGRPKKGREKGNGVTFSSPSERGNSADYLTARIRRDARLWEIAENLHRADLTALERDRELAEWIRLTDERLKAQPAPLEAVATKTVG